MRHVGLIEIAARQGHIRPIDFPLALCALYDLQEPLQPAKQLRRRSDLFAEELAEAPAAEARLPGEIDNALNMRHAQQLFQSMGDSRMQFEAALSCRFHGAEQATLQNPKLPFGSARFQQPTT